jgi:hypothetical protein
MEGCGECVTDLRGHCVQTHIPGVFAGGSLELPDWLLTTGNRRLHNASLLGAGMSPNSSMRALLLKGKPEGNQSHQGAPPVRGVQWRDVGSASLT